MRVRYIGPFFDGVRLPMPEGRDVNVAYDEVIEVSDSLGRSLIRQKDNWKQVADPAPAPTAKPAPQAVKKED